MRAFKFFPVLCLVSIVYGLPTFSAEPNLAPQQPVPMRATIILLPSDGKSEPQFQALQSDGSYKSVSRDYAVKALNSITEEAKKAACGLKVRPSQVSASAGFVSLTWDTDRLCK